MEKYIRVYRAIIHMNIAHMMAYRVSAINGAIASTGWGMFQLAWIFMLTDRVHHVYGWSRDELILLAMGYVLVIGVFHLFFSRGFEDFSYVVNRGELDAYLLRPIDTQFFVSTLRIRLTNIVRITLGLAAMIWWIQHRQIPVSPEGILMFLFFASAGIVVVFSFWFFFSSLLIWYPNLNNLSDFLYTFNGFARFPVEMMLRTGNIVLYMLVPLMLVVAVPVKALLWEFNATYITILFLSALTLFILSRLFWKFALRSYTSVG